MDYGNVGKDLESQRWKAILEDGILCKGIRKFQWELNILVSEFPQFSLFGRKMPEVADSENYWPDSSSSAQTQKVLEDYKNKKKFPLELNVNQI